MKINQVKKLLLNNVDLKYKSFQEKLIETKNVILGIRMPILEQIAKKIYNNNYTEFILENDYSSYELIILQALVICKIKDIQEVCHYLDEFINHIDCWASNDTLCSHLKIVKKNQNIFFNYLSKYFNSPKEFIQRFVVVMLMIYYLDEKNVDLSISIIEKINSKEYYSMMSISWFITSLICKYQDIGINYLKNTKHNIFIVNKAISKCRDSYLIDDETKTYLLSLKRKEKEN